MLTQAVEQISSVAGGSYLPFQGTARARSLIKAGSLRIAGDLTRLSLVLAVSGATVVGCWWAAASGEVPATASATLLGAIPTFAALLLLLLSQQRRDREDIHQVVPGRSDVARSAALAFGVGIAWTTIGRDAAADGVLPLLSLATLASFAIALFAAGVSALLDGIVHTRPVWSHLVRNIAVYGVSPEGDRVHAEIEKSYGLRFVGLFDDRAIDRLVAEGVQHPKAPISGGVTDLLDLIARGEVDEVVISLPATATERMAQLSRRLQQFPVDVHLCAQIATRSRFPAESERTATSIGAASLTRVQRRPIRDWGVILKALEDFVLGSAMLLVLSPLFALIAIAIKLDSAGPVFFRQRRHGVCGQSSVVWKFRTMHVMENGAQVRQATKNDPRVTAVGRVLRATSLDELPQLINVVMGEMSLVGPRPHAVAHDEYYADLIEAYGGRHQVKPGITGWAQIHGLRGETRTPDQMVKRVEADIWYIRNWSLWLDLKILLLTPVFGLINKNAY